MPKLYAYIGWPWLSSTSTSKPLRQTNYIDNMVSLF